MIEVQEIDDSRITNTIDDVEVEVCSRCGRIVNVPKFLGCVRCECGAKVGACDE